MNVTAPGMIRATGLAAVLAGLTFVVIQPIHPADVLASVSTDAWAIIHYASLVMVMLFLVGIVGIYARQVEKLGWLGLAGLVLLSLGLLLTAALGVVEVFVAPLLVESEPDFVHGFLGMVGGHPTDADLGAMPLLWSASSVGFLGGTLLFGIANLRAGVLSRWASGVFAFGLLASAPVVGLLGAPRLAAVPVGIGLAWLGYSLWSERREPATAPVLEAGTPQPDPVAAG
ncbi:MAG: hypothetical protein ACRDG7_07560 [Candidatus Limnocylindria bacterium]